METTKNKLSLNFFTNSNSLIIFIYSSSFSFLF